MTLALPFNTISVVGLGYIGLPTAATLATRGVRVLGYDIDPRTVEHVNSGKPHIVEPELDILVQAAVQSGKLTASLCPQAADAFILAVPTPFHDETKKPDITYVIAAARSIAPTLKKGNLVIVESTIPVGTTEEVSRVLAEMRPDLTFPHTHGEESDVDVAHCPERILPGFVIRELVENDRVIGGINQRSASRAESLYRIFVEGKIAICQASEAEFVKLAENAFRDVNIAYANELSMICDQLGLNVWKVIEMANLHPRVNILSPGPGVGGHCIAVDPWFIVDAAPKQANLIRMARNVNDSKPELVIQQVQNAACSLGEPVIACLGLSYKPDTDDLRSSPAVYITGELAKRFPGKVLAVEPNIEQLPGALNNSVQLATLDEALQRAAILVILVSHREFAQLMAQIPESAVVIDTVGLAART